MIKLLFTLGLAMTITYASTLELDADKSPTGQKVYSGEYGVCILATGDVADATNLIKEKFSKDLPPITPHITLLQGKFSDESLAQLKETLKTFTSTQVPFSITMSNQLTKGGGGNTFWDVERSIPVWKHLNSINDKLCHTVPHPVGLMKQVQDSLDDRTGNHKQIDRWGRDFNIPESNRPHITVAYGSQDEAAINDVNKTLNQSSFAADQLHLVKIDYSGSIVAILEGYNFLGKQE